MMLKKNACIATLTRLWQPPLRC